MEEYAAALCREIERTAAWLRRLKGSEAIIPLRTIYLGGGTPSLMPAEALRRIRDCLVQTFGLADGAECTIEVNPGSIPAERWPTLRDAGFNRVSIGFQAMQDHLLRAIGRIHDASQAIHSIRDAADAGFSNISVDLMLGLPGQTIDDLLESARQLLKLPIDHLSFYSLQLEPGTPLADQIAQGRLVLPDEETERAQYHQLRAFLTEQGMPPYEISNAARPGKACRHNLVYWHGLPYYGFGVAAHAFLAGRRIANTIDPDRYLAVMQESWVADVACDDSSAAGANRRAAGKARSPANADRTAHSAAEIEEVVDRDEAQKEMLMLALRLSEGLSREAYRMRFEEALDRRFGEILRRLVRRGLVEDDGVAVRLSKTGLDLANQVWADVLDVPVLPP